ncbi:peptidase S1 [Brevundimonas sp.]|uniref:peptidase S1 n=1 Tax=Brevundimonas sp. TaxID=1871086 RepID=UPI0025BA43BD|nr:peptidase S1 [Brevundimonas sp.]
MKHQIVRLASCLAVTSLALSTPALAQEIGAQPTFADISLNAGFMPDPTRIQVTAGGSIDAAHSRGGSCVGKIARAPDVRVTYEAGSSPLIIKVNSSEDTTLVMNGANGRWYCDDDGAGGVNPRIRLNNPDSGVYEIWVGTYADEPVSATVLITELSD